MDPRSGVPIEVNLDKTFSRRGRGGYSVEHRSLGLGQYLVDRGADGVRVFFWYHRQFIEAATDRYCSDKDTVQKMHAALADYFAGTWAHGI